MQFACREIVVETGSTHGNRPKPRAALDRLQPGDLLVIYGLFTDEGVGPVGASMPG